MRDPSPLRHPTGRRSHTALAAGLILLGLLAISAAVAATLATVLLFAVLLLLAGAGQVTRALDSRSGAGAWDLIAGIVYLVAGGLMVIDPLGGAIGLTLLAAIFFFVIGVSRLALATRSAATGVVVLTGVLDLVLGLIILVGWPGTGAWVIGLFLGIELLMAGVGLLLGAGSPDVLVAPPVSPRQAGPAGSESRSS